jgi:hypothetical protein
MKPTKGLALTIAAAALAWLLFLLGEIALHFKIGVAELLLPRDYAGRFFGLVLILLALFPVLVLFVIAALRRRQIRVTVAILTVVLYPPLNFLLLKLVQPFFVTAFPG